MKLLLSISLLFSFSIFADNHDSDDSQWNVAEYYVSAFKDGKDMDDMMKWAEKWNAWANETDDLKDYTAALLVPYYHSGEQPHDFVWVGLSPNPEAHFKGNDHWFNNGGKLLAELNKILVTGLQTTYTWQRNVTQTPSGQASYAVYSDCTLGEDVTADAFYEAYVAYAEAAKKLGDIAGRKMIFPASGGTEGDYDFVYSLYARNVAELGAAADNYWENINGSDADLALSEVIEGCSNYSTYTTDKIK